MYDRTVDNDIVFTSNNKIQQTAYNVLCCFILKLIQIKQDNTIRISLHYYIFYMLPR